MDVNKLLKTVHNLNDYISATQEVISKHSNSKIQFNMSTVLSLKKIRSLEIEYFNKCDESGAGIKILELMLRLPPSKTWSLLGKELVLLMQYWLEAIRKHLILHNNHWWNFLSTLLEFIQEIRSKHTVLSNILVQDLSECLLDLATKAQPTVVQRLRLLQCYNSVCAESSRETRYALRNKLGLYFVKLSSLLLSCGDMRAQYSIMETLLRWLVPRHDVAVKHEAAAKWFPQNLFNVSARKIFIERPWQNFFKDARAFLNAHNASSHLITTVLCRRFCIGNVTLISGTDKDYYLDLNTSTEVISLMMEPDLSDVLGSSAATAVIISKDNTSTIRVSRESSHLLMSIDVVEPRLLYPSPLLRDTRVAVLLSSRSDLTTLHRTLTHIFDTKYELLMDLEQPPPTSPASPASSVRGERRGNDHVAEQGGLEGRKRSGCMVRAKLPASWQSPSTASTSSLALLREKLTAFPGYKFDKEPVSVCAAPQLSSVSERTEDAEHAAPPRACGVCSTKCHQRGRDRGQRSTTPLGFDESSISCLLVATIGSNESVINDTLERLPKDKELHTDNIVELLAREALQAIGPKRHGGVVTSETVHSEVNSDVIEDTPRAPSLIDQATVPGTAAVDALQLLSDRRGVQTASLALEENQRTSYDIRAVEDFFSQHCSRNRDADLLISPTLARKINETSSESSLDLDIRTPPSGHPGTTQYEVRFNYGDAEVIECLNDVLDKVVIENPESCAEDLSKETELMNECDRLKEIRRETALKEIQDMAKPPNKRQKKNTRLKLQFKNTKPLKSRGKKQNKLATESIKRMTTIIEKDSDGEKTLLKNSSPESNPLRSYDHETPFVKRKRKLYSPKDDNAANGKAGIHIADTEDDDSLLPATEIAEETPKALATSYKYIEKLRTSARNLRIRKSGIDLSPRTKRNNDIFDNLKKTVEGEREIILADKKISSRNKKLAVYNFSSDSEDNDFQKRKGTKKCTSTVGSVESGKSTRARKSNKEKKKKPVRRRKSKSDLKQQIPDPGNEMIDERMRDAAGALDASLVVEPARDLEPPAPEPAMREEPRMEVIEDGKDLPPRRTTRRKRPTNTSLKKEKIAHKDNNIAGEREPSVRSSPLPGLIIETVQVQVHKDPDDSITAAMLEKYQHIYNDEPLPDISEINTTHNLLSDLEHVAYDSNLNITEEFNTTNRSVPVSKRLRNRVLSTSPKAKKNKLSTTHVRDASEPQIIALSEDSDAKSDKSIATLGKSPITGHGDVDEAPPSPEQLAQRYEPRGLDTQDLSQSMKDYFDSLTKDTNEPSQSSHSDEAIHAKALKKSPIKLIRNMCSANISPTISLTRMSSKEVGRWLTPRVDSIFGSNQSSEDDQPVRVTRSRTRSQAKLQQNKSNSITTKSSKTNIRKSAISPIKMFGEDHLRDSVTSERHDYVEDIKSIMATKREVAKTDTKSNSSRHDLRKRSSRTASSKNSTHVDGSTKSRRSSAVFDVAKEDRPGTIVSDVESAQGSSVNDWLNRNELQKRSRENADLSLKDNLEKTLEKLETTLSEIHHKTSKKFVSMFVDAQRHLAELKDRRRQLYKQTALDVISDIVQVMDTKFGELERRSQELDGQFMAGLQQGAGAVLRADRAHKAAMVALLKDDVRSALDHLHGDARTHSE